MANEERCVCCGEVIPEGSQVCWNCNTKNPGKEKCVDCPHFRIMYGPLKSGKDIWDLGKAKCEKLGLYVEFASKRTLNKLECVEGKYKKAGKD